jgi:hypothetical protein
LTHEETAEIKHPYDLAQKVIENPKTIGWVGKGEKARQILQPADVRIPHPHMIGLERDRIENPNERQRAQDRREASQQTVSPAESRFDYRIQEATFTKETTGANGRAPWAVGRRYGVPHNDRTRGTVKIPTRVDA